MLEDHYSPLLKNNAILGKEGYSIRCEGSGREGRRHLKRSERLRFEEYH
jgi:hypothetical protein